MDWKILSSFETKYFFKPFCREVGNEWVQATSPSNDPLLFSIRLTFFNMSRYCSSCTRDHHFSWLSKSQHASCPLWRLNLFRATVNRVSRRNSTIKSQAVFSSTENQSYYLFNLWSYDCSISNLWTFWVLKESGFQWDKLVQPSHRGYSVRWTIRPPLPIHSLQGLLFAGRPSVWRVNLLL